MCDLSFFDFAAYLDSVASLYPGGVPERYIKDSSKDAPSCGAVSCCGNREAPLLFVGLRSGSQGGFEGREGELLAAAITKGMKLSLGDVQVLSVFSCLGGIDEQEEARAALKENLALSKPKLIVLLGLETLRLCGFSPEGKRGEWLTWQEIPVMPTHALKPVLSDLSVKKEFWQDLKQVLERLSEI